MKPGRFLAAAALLTACSADLPHEAPFDPGAPLEKQARASLTSTVRLEGETDFSQVTLDLQNAERTYNVDTAADGKVSLTGVVPGTYTLSLRTRYFEGVTEAITIGLGDTVNLGTRTLVPRKSRVLGQAVSERLVGSELAQAGGVNLSLKKTGSIRSATASAPAYQASAVPPPAGYTLRTLSGTGGDYEFAAVPAGVYNLAAATPETGERDFGKVTVTGEGDVTVEPIVLRPLTGYFEIQGLANGVPSSTYTSVATVNLQLQQSNAVKVKVAVSTDGKVTGCDLVAAAKEALPSNTLRPLTFANEGKKLVCVSFIDADGKETAPIYGTITYDATPPSLPIVQVNGGASVVGSNVVTLTLSAVDANGVAYYKVGSAAGVTATSAKPFQTTDVLSLGATDGLQSAWVMFGDPAGNYSAPIRVTVTLDTTAPTFTSAPVVAKLDGTPLTTGATLAESRVKLVSTYADATGLEMQVSTTGSYAGQAWVPYDSNKIIELPSGASSLSVRVRDGAGHVVDVVTAFALTVDATPPTGTLVITPGAVTDPAITVQATGSADAVGVELAFDPGFVTSLGTFVPGPLSVTLSAGDGTKTVYARFFDAAGNASALVGDTVVLDTTPPQIVTYAIAQTSPTKDNPVTVQYTALGAAELRITEGAVCGGVREPVGAGTRSFTLSAAEGVKQVHLQFFDAAGNASECAVRSITYDPNPPVVGTLQINYGQAATSSNVVTLSFPGVSGASKILVSEDAGFVGADWQSYAATKTFTLSAGNGVKTVYAKVADDAGHVVNLPAQTITLDTTPPSAPAIYAAADVTTQTSVLVTLSAGLVNEMWVTVDDPGFTTGAWETYTGLKSVALSGPDGTKTIYAKFKKSTGLETSAVSDTVVLDRAAPILPTVAVNGGAAVVTSNVVTLSLSAVDAASGLATYKVNTTNDFTAVSPKPFQPTDVFSFAPGDGVKTVWVTIGDRAGLYSTPVSATVLLDTTAPGASSVVVTKLDGTPLTAGGTVTDNRVIVSSSVTDLSALEMQVTTNGSFVGVAWVPYEATKIIDLTTGTPSLSVRVRDGAGLITNLLTAFTLTVDTAAPTLTFSRTSAAVSSSLTVNLALTASEPSEAQVSESASFGGVAWFAAANTAVVLPAGDGVRTLYARARDLAGNVSAVMSVTVQIDTVAPSGSLLINQGAAATVTNAVTLQLSGVDTGSGLGGVKLADSLAGLAAAPVVPMEATKAYTLGGAAGPGIEETKTVWMQVVDRAGLASPAVSDTIRFDRKNPAGSIALSAAVTKDTLVSVDLGFDPDVTHMKLSAGDACAGGNWVEASTQTVFTVPGLDGTHDVSVRFRDGVLNESTCYSASVVLDRAGPTPQTFSITGNAGASAGYSDSPNVTLDAATAAGDCAYAEVSEDVGFIAPTAAGLACTLSAHPYVLANAADGYHTLYLRYFDALGNAGPVTGATLVLDSTDPQVTVTGGFTIAAGAFTNDADVTLQLSAASATQVAFGEGAGCGFAPQSYEATKRLTLSGADGPKVISVRYADEAGNASACYAQTVTLDTFIAVPALGLVGFDGRSGITASQAVTATVTGADASDVVEMRVSNFASFAGAPWEPFRPVFDWLLPSGDGARTAYVELRDRAGNVHDVYAGIVLDMTPPPTPVLQSIDIDGDGFALSGVAVELSWSASFGATALRLQSLVSGLGADFADIGAMSPAASTYVAAVTAPGYRHLFRIGAYDGVGNFSGWSNVVEASPILPQSEIAWTFRRGAYQYQIPVQRGVYSNSWAFAHDNLDDTTEEFNLVANVASWTRPVTTAFEINERIRLRTENSDRSLAYEGEYPLGTVLRRQISTEKFSFRWDLAYDEQERRIRGVNAESWKLRYVERDADGNWSWESIPHMGTVGTTARLLWQPGREPGVVFDGYDGGPYLYTAWRQGDGTWSTSALTNSTIITNYTQLAGVLDRSGAAHVLYSSVDSFSPYGTMVYFAADVSRAAWNPIPVTATGDFTTPIALEIAPDDTLYAAMVSSTGGLYVINLSANPWTWELVDVSATEYLEFEITPDGTRRLAYRRNLYPGTPAKYAYNDGSGWVVETVTADYYQLYPACLVADEDGTVHYFLNDATNEDLLYARRDPATGWGPVQMMQRNGRVGFGCDAVKTGRNSLSQLTVNATANYTPVELSFYRAQETGATLVSGLSRFVSTSDMFVGDSRDPMVVQPDWYGSASHLRVYRNVFSAVTYTESPELGYLWNVHALQPSVDRVSVAASVQGSGVWLFEESGAGWSSEPVTSTEVVMGAGFAAGVTHVVVADAWYSVRKHFQRLPGGWSASELPNLAPVFVADAGRYWFSATETVWAVSGAEGVSWGVYLARRTDGAWGRTRIATGPTSVGSFQQDTKGNFWVLAVDNNSIVRRLFVIENTSGVWRATVIGTSETILNRMAIAFDHAGRPVVLAHPDGLPALFRLIDGRWIKTPLTGVPVNSTSEPVWSLAVDAEDNVHITYGTADYYVGTRVERFPIGVLKPQRLGPVGPAQ